MPNTRANGNRGTVVVESNGQVEPNGASPARDTNYEAYLAEIAAAKAAYQAAMGPIDAAYKEAIKPAVTARNKARTEARATYNKAVRVADRALLRAARSTA